jgi:hypothetical protein
LESLSEEAKSEKTKHEQTTAALLWYAPVGFDVVMAEGGVVVAHLGRIENLQPLRHASEVDDPLEGDLGAARHDHSRQITAAAT